MITTAIRLRFDRRSTPVQLQFDRARTIQRPMLIYEATALQNTDIRLLTAKPFSVFFKTLKQFSPSYCQISTDLDKILHTPIMFGIHLWADLDRDRHVGGSRPNQNDYVFTRAT